MAPTVKNMSTPCLSCKSLRGEITLSPGGVIYQGKYWQVEHVYPTTIRGWLVIVLRRHIRALHELRSQEWDELARIQRVLVNVLRQTMRSEKEYIACFTEQQGFRHIHFHVIAKPRTLPSDARGSRIFSLLKIDKSQAVPVHDVEVLCERLRRRLRKKKV